MDVRKVIEGSAVLLLILAGACGGVKGTGPVPGGLQPFPLPSSAFHVGQVVAVYTRPQKVSIITDPASPVDSAATIQVSQSTISSSKGTIEAGYKTVVAGSLGGKQVNSVSVEYMNPRALQGIQGDLVSSLVTKLKANPQLRGYIASLQKDGIILNVIETIYLADISLTFKDETGATIDVSGTALQELKAKASGDYTSQSNGTVLGKGLAIGFHTSPDVLRYVMTQVP
jgi:hypothetical protein